MLTEAEAVRNGVYALSLVTAGGVFGWVLFWVVGAYWSKHGMAGPAKRARPR